MLRKLIQIILCFAISTNIFGQVDGDYFDYYDENNQKIRVKGTYKDGKQHGEWIEYERNGKIKIISNYDNGIPVGLWKWNLGSNGIITGSFINGRKSGTWLFYNQNDKLDSVLSYMNDTLDGGCQYFDHNDESSCTIFYSNGIEKWRSKEIRDIITGNKIIINKISDGKKEGLWIQEDYLSFNDIETEKPNAAYSAKIGIEGERDEFFDDIEFIYQFKFSKGYFINGKKEGLWKFYKYNLFDPPQISGNYKNGEKNGEWICYCENSDSISFSGNYLMGKKTGQWKSYNCISYLGKRYIDRISNYKEGIIDGDFTSYSANNLIRKIGKYKNGVKEGQWNSYYDNSPVLSSSRIYKNGLRHGESKNYFYNGNIESVQEFQNDKANGKYCHYYRNTNTQVDVTGFYKNGNEDGLWIYYNENGKKSADGKYFNGRKIGLWRSYFMNGQLKAEVIYK